MDEARGKKELK
jgi:hypothetical protein